MANLVFIVGLVAVDFIFLSLIWGLIEEVEALHDEMDIRRQGK